MIGNFATQNDLQLAFRFLSNLWGGRFCQMLAVASDGNDPLAIWRLSQSRPDFVYGVAIDHAAWHSRVAEACQARGYAPLTSEYVEHLFDSAERHITAAHVVHHLRRLPAVTGQQQRPLMLIDCEPQSPLLPYLAALVGLHYSDFEDALPNNRLGLLSSAGIAGFVDAHAELVSTHANCWLDLTSEGLSTSMTNWWLQTPPTIVLVDSIVHDLTLFWNLRQAADCDIPVWAIPIPSTSAFDPAVVASLKKWLLAFEIYAIRCNFCRVTSSSVGEQMLSNFATRFREEMEGSMIEHVDVWHCTKRLPVVVAYDSVQRLSAEVTKQTLTMRPAKPDVLDGTRGSWMIDFLQDVERSRAINELCLPPHVSTFSVLNAPGPTSISLKRIPTLGDGVDGINARCSGSDDALTVCLPSAEEILEEILREAGIEPVVDEKRACYLPVMRMMGGLYNAAQTFSGQRAKILTTLLAGPLQVSQIQGAAKLGKGKLPELSQPEFPNEMLSHLDSVAKRTFSRRRRQRWSKVSPLTTGIESLLEFWADKGIVSRQWQLGPCPACMGSFWEAHLNISKPVSCPGCGNRLRLPPQVSMGYSLHRLVSHAIRQGIVPVMLAGRFLKRMTHRGFLWMPGVKYQWQNEKGDVDFLACCDGHIVVGECKTLDKTPSDAGLWETIREQFAKTIEVGKACRAGIAVLAIMAETYPTDFQTTVESLGGSSLRCLLLNKHDLEKAYRSVTNDGVSRYLSIKDLVIDPMPEAPRQAYAIPRVMKTPLFSAT